MPAKNLYFKSFGLFAFFVSLALISGCGKSKALPALSTPEVGVIKVEKQTIPMFDEFSGTVASVRTVNIIPRVSGYIDKCYFTEGSLVKEGDPLYLIDPRPFQAKLDAAQAQLKLDNAQLAFAQTEVDRYTLLAKNQATSVEKMQEVVSKRDQLVAAVEKDKADVATAQLNLSFTAINAPFTGHIQKMNIDVGNLVTAQQDVLTALIQMNPIYVNFALSRAKSYNFQKLKRDNKLFPQDKMFIKLSLPDGSEYSETGKIQYVSYLIDSSTDCVTVRGVIPNRSDKKHDYTLIPGQYVPVKFVCGENTEALMVPQTAIVESQLGQQIYVVDAADKVEARSVVLGSRQGSLCEIKTGLKAGENVVTQGVQKIRSGIKVKTVPDTTLLSVPDAPPAPAKTDTAVQNAAPAAAK